VNYKALVPWLVLALIGPLTQQNQPDDYRDGPGLEVVKWEIVAVNDFSPEKAYRSILKVKNTGEKTITGFSYDIIVYDGVRADIIASSLTITVKKSLKPGEAKDFDNRLPHIASKDQNTAVRIMKISYDDGTSWYRFEKK
jgi:hypothetical protein